MIGPHMNRTVSIAKAKARFAECIRRAEAGERVVLTRHGRPVAQLAPIGSPPEALAGELREPEGSYETGQRERIGPPASASRREALERLLEEAIWPRVPEDQVGAGPGKRERERILGYGGEGV